MMCKKCCLKHTLASGKVSACKVKEPWRVVLMDKHNDDNKPPYLTDAIKSSIITRELHQNRWRILKDQHADHNKTQVKRGYI